LLLRLLSLYRNNPAPPLNILNIYFCKITNINLANPIVSENAGYFPFILPIFIVDYIVGAVIFKFGPDPANLL
jgi:hypothetical protein